jgi:hypothetical protein
MADVPDAPAVLTSKPRKRHGQVLRDALRAGLKMTTTTASNNRQTVFEVGAASARTGAARPRIRTRRRGQFPARR